MYFLENVQKKENKKIVGEWKLFFLLREKKRTYINFYKFNYNFYILKEICTF